MIMKCLKTALYCNFGEKCLKCRKTVKVLRLFTTSGFAISQASPVDAESEGEGLQVPPLTRN
jgi:hypothetical protein